MESKVLIIVNTGTPDSPEKEDVRKFLSEFLNDFHVIDLPWFLRKILVNLIIIPFRTPKSAGLYRKLWTSKGSPLLINHNKLVSKLSDRLEGKYSVIGAMRYGNPSLKSILRKLEHVNLKEIVVFPLYPQYASSTTGSVSDLLIEETRKWNSSPSIRMIGQFYSEPSFISAFSKQISAYNPVSFEHIIFSYHGLPLRQINKSHPEIDQSECSCEEALPEHGALCYKATCYETTRLLAEKLAIPPGRYSTSFQSRLSKNWLTPFTDKRIEELRSKGTKRILVAAPSFVADCLETIVEINDDYRNHFIRSGGDDLVLVESLNDNDDWADAIVQLSGTKKES